MLLSMERLALGPGHGEFEPTNYAATMIAGGLDGAIASKVGPLGKFASSTLVGGVGGQAIDDALDGRTSSPADYGVAALSGAVSFGTSSGLRAVFPRLGAAKFDAPYRLTRQVNSRWLSGVSKSQLQLRNAMVRLDKYDFVRQFLNGFGGSVFGDFTGDVAGDSIP